MHQYIIEFKKYKATGLYTFNEKGALVKYEFDPGTFEQAQWDYYLIRFPHTINEIEGWKRLSKQLDNIFIRAVQQDLSFDAFYNKYNYKHGKRARAMSAWNALSDVDKAKALAYIPKYDMHLLQTGINKKYAEFFLSAAEWNN